MNWEGQVYGFANPNAQPPTPIPTPTSTTGPGFSGTPFLPESPEVTEFDPQTKREGSHYQEYLRAFFQSPVPTQQVSQQSLAPSPASFRRPSSSPSHKRHSSVSENQIGPASGVQRHSRFSNLPGSPVHPSNQLSSSPFPSPTKPAKQVTPAKFSSYSSADQAVNSARSIQTPPPSRTMTERSMRRKLSKTRLQTTKNTSGGGHRYIRSDPLDSNPLDGHGSAQQESRDLHQAFQNSQVSSNVLDMFGYPLSAPASTPAFSHKLFWDPYLEENGIGASFDDEHDLANQNVDVSNQNLGWDITEQNGRLNEQTGASPLFFRSMPDNRASQNLVTQSGGFSTFEFSQVPLSQPSLNSFSYTPAISDGVVNPNLIFSLSTQSNANHRLERSGPDTSRMQPYHHQTQELERERMLENTRKIRQQKSASAHGQSSSNSSNPPIERSQHLVESATSTSNRAIRSGQPSATNALGIINDENMAPERRSSPSKRAAQQATLSSIAGKHAQPRTMISFTIDDQGHAKAETKFVVEESEWETDVGAGIGHEEEGDTESDTSTDSDVPDVISRKPSFAFPVGRSERPKLARFNTAPLGRPSGYPNPKMLPSSMSGSENRSTYEPSEYSSRLSSPSRRASLYTGRPNHGRANNFRRQSGSSFDSSKLHGTSFSALRSFHDKETASEAETVLEENEDFDDGTAQNAIKQLIKRKKQKQTEDAASYPPPNKKTSKGRRIYSSPGSTHLHQETPSFQRQTSTIYGDTLNVSPTTVTDPDIATPSTGRGSRSTTDTRCVCHKVNFEGLMILCESCNMWLHAKCVGLKEKSLPKVYVCNYCIGNTPVARGGRIRVPRRTNTGIPSSPLAHKANKLSRR